MSSLFSDKEYAQRAGSAMAGDGAACGGFEYLFKAGIQLVDFAAHLLNGHGIAFGVGDKNTVLVDVT